MKVRAMRLLIVAVCVCFVLPVVPQRSFAGDTEKPELVFATFPSQGMGVLFQRILAEAYDRIGYTAVVRGVPAERALVMSNQGKVDGEAARVPVIERDYFNLLRVPTPLYTNRIVVYTKRMDIDPNESWKGLYPYRVASVIGYKFIEKKTRTMKRKLVPNYEQLFSMLNEDRVDLVVAEYFDSLPKIKKAEMTNVHRLDPPYAYNPMYHYLHKKHADLVPKIDAVLRAMVEEGRMDAILKEMEREYASQWAMPCSPKTQ